MASSRRWGRGARWFIAATVLACSGCGTADFAPGDSDDLSTDDRRPNIVFILTDDLDSQLYAKMTRLRGLLEPQGTVFNQHIVSISLCCPSRVATLTGKYAHNTGVFSNEPPTGGFQVFYDSGGESTTVATLLHAAGYHTVLMGKYLNGYPAEASKTYIPPGWDDWFSPVAGEPYHEYDYTLNENGHLVRYGHDASDYMVDVLAEKAASYIATRDPSRPFFMLVTPYKPHQPATPPPRYLNEFPNERAPQTPSFNETDMSDKPPWMVEHALFSKNEIKSMDDLYRKRMRSMLAITDLVEKVEQALDVEGLLDDTDIVFSSDNGYHIGQHRLPAGKNTGYDEDLLVPLVVRGPHARRGELIEQQTANIDYAPTFLEWAGEKVPADMDGRSFECLLRGQTASWRDAVLLEHLAKDVIVWPNTNSGTLEPSDAATGSGVPVFVGLRTPKLTYLEYVSGEIELYDHQRDPDQLDNASAEATMAQLVDLRNQLDNLRGCSGDGCR